MSRRVAYHKTYDLIVPLLDVVEKKVAVLRKLGRHISRILMMWYNHRADTALWPITLVLNKCNELVIFVVVYFPILNNNLRLFSILRTAS